MGFAPAYLLTWTTYASRLHGDVRGSVQVPQNRHGDPFVPVDPQLAKIEGRLARSEPIILSADDRDTIALVLRRVCEKREWVLWAMNVRTNHVHVVVSAHRIAPERVCSQFKSWCTRELVRLGRVGSEDRVWTKGASTRYLWTEDHRNRAVWYVLYAQDGDRFETGTQRSSAPSD